MIFETFRWPGSDLLKLDMLNVAQLINIAKKNCIFFLCLCTFRLKEKEKFLKSKLSTFAAYLGGMVLKVDKR